MPEKTEVLPAGYGLSTLLMMSEKVWTRSLLKILLRVMTLPRVVHALLVYTPVELMEYLQVMLLLIVY